MELEEAKKVLMSLPEYQDLVSKECEAIDTVIAELHAMQNLLDEKNEELDRLQKENEELKKDSRNRVIGSRNLIKKCKDCNLKECIGCEYSASDIEATFKNFVSKDKIRELISKIDADIETNDRRMIMYEEEKGTSRYVCKLIAYDPRSVKIILQDLLKEE